MDLERAAKLLDEAGYAPDEDGMRMKVTLDYPTFHIDSLTNGANYIKSQLKKVGIDVKLRAPADFPSWAQQISSWDYQFTLNDHWNYPDPVIGVHRIYLCGNIKNQIWSNTQGYCNEKVDALLQEAGRTLDFDKRKALYEEFQLHVNRGPAALLHQRGALHHGVPEVGDEPARDGMGRDAADGRGLA